MLEKHVDNHTSCLFLVLLHLNISLTRWRPILGMSAGDILKKPEIQSEATMESDTCVSYCFLCPHIFPELLSSFFLLACQASICSTASESCTYCCCLPDMVLQYLNML